MNTLRKNVLIALAALSLGGTALAVEQQAIQNPQQRPALTQEQRDAKIAERQAKRAERHAKMAERRAKRQQELHAALKLSASQEQAWTAFVASTKPAEHAKRGDRRAEFAKLTAPQRMEKMIERQKERTAKMESRLAAIKTFYAVLTPEQQKVFDQKAMRGHRFHRGGHGHGGHRGHGAMQS